VSVKLSENRRLASSKSSKSVTLVRYTRLRSPRGQGNAQDRRDQGAYRRTPENRVQLAECRIGDRLLIRIAHGRAATEFVNGRDIVVGGVESVQSDGCQHRDPD